MAPCLGFNTARENLIQPKEKNSPSTDETRPFLEDAGAYRVCQALVFAVTFFSTLPTAAAPAPCTVQYITKVPHAQAKTPGAFCWLMYTKVWGFGFLGG
jgi:hypothetical protein